jgi:hypothetical protein
MGVHLCRRAVPVVTDRPPVKDNDVVSHVRLSHVQCSYKSDGADRLRDKGLTPKMWVALIE